MAAQVPARGTKTRIHGSFRLAHALLAQNDFVIIDFDAACAGKHSPLRDVATMLRSLDGVARAAIDRAGRERGDDFANAERATRDWRYDAGGAFLGAYFEAAPPALREARPLLDLFVVEAAMRDLDEALLQHPERLELLLRGLPPDRAAELHERAEPR
jgi:maltose alpha-D-glucosyltransferase/alpha-amylase